MEKFTDVAEKLEKKPIIPFKKIKGSQQEAIESFDLFLERITEYRFNAVYGDVLDEAIDYVQSICDSFQIFYNVFEGRVSQLDANIKNIEKKYHNLSGHAVRYVCASPTCLKKLHAKAAYSSDGLDLPGDLCDEIYTKIRSHAMMGEDKPKSDGYFLELFDSAILQYFRDSLMQSYGSEIDVDVITALEKEAGYEHDKFTREEVERYVEDAISSTKILAAPFIEAPLGEQRQPIRACAYNPDLYIKGDINREALINRTLANNGGVKDDDIDKNMILFYEALYGLCANDLSKFAPPSQSATSKRDGGEYFTAYYDLINQIRPGEDVQRIITPHLDREWHLLSKIPDLDAENQKNMEKRICKAMLFGLIFKKIRRYKVGKHDMHYRLSAGNDTMDFIVSNHTPCDSFYEILDALTINPPVVKMVLKSIDDELKRERTRKVKFENSMIRFKLEDFKLKEFSEDRIWSIFDIPALMKISTPSSEYYEENGKEMTRNILDIMYEYMADYCSKQALDDEYTEFIMGQFKRFESNHTWYDTEYEGMIDDLYLDMKNIISNRLRNLDMYEEAEYVARDD